jgi:uncharacterized OsmC-like protein
MVVVREKTSVTQRIHGNCSSHSRTEISVRDVRSIIDEPRERDGTNMGPTPTETIVSALIACTNVISHKCARKYGVEFKVMTIDAESTFDRRGAQLQEEIEVPFPKIRSYHQRDDGCQRGRHGKGKGRLASLLPGIQGSS